MTDENEKAYFRGVSAGAWLMNIPRVLLLIYLHWIGRLI